MPRFLKQLLGALLAVAILVGALAACYIFILYPQLKPMMNWDRAHALSMYLSKITSEDFKALNLPVPTGKAKIPQAEMRQLIDRLHATGRFPEWKSNSKLDDLYGHPYVFSVRLPTDSDEPRINSMGSSWPGEFIFGVSYLGLPRAIEY